MLPMLWSRLPTGVPQERARFLRPYMQGMRGKRRAGGLTPQGPRRPREGGKGRIVKLYLRRGETTIIEQDGAAIELTGVFRDCTVEIEIVAVGLGPVAPGEPDPRD